MNRRAYSRFAAGSAHALAACLALLAVTLLAQTPPVPQSPPALAKALLSAPPLPVTRSPVDTFRELLAMNEGDLRQFLATRPAEGQKRIRAKLKEYRDMTPEDRELRLQVTELQWYLLPLLKVPGTNRLEQLATIPGGVRKLVEDRLAWWDRLTPEVQKAWLENEATLRYLTDTATITLEQRDALLQKMNPERRQQLLAGLDSWQQMTETQRQAIADHFKRFFQLSPEEQQKTLNTLSEPERAQLEKTFQLFRKLDATQRAKCLTSFGKLACMSVEERVQFLRNADRWEQMSPSERQQWKTLVYRLWSEPPLPNPAELPPLPPSLRPKTELRRPAVTLSTTNRE